MYTNQAKSCRICRAGAEVNICWYPRPDLFLCHAVLSLGWLDSLCWSYTNVQPSVCQGDLFSLEARVTLFMDLGCCNPSLSSGLFLIWAFPCNFIVFNQWNSYGSSEFSLFWVSMSWYSLPFLRGKSLQPLSCCRDHRKMMQFWALPYVFSSRAELEECIFWQFSGRSFSSLWNLCLPGKWQYSCVLGKASSTEFIAILNFKHCDTCQKNSSACSLGQFFHICMYAFPYLILAPIWSKTVVFSVDLHSFPHLLRAVIVFCLIVQTKNCSVWELKQNFNSWHWQWGYRQYQKLSGSHYLYKINKTHSGL